MPAAMPSARWAAASPSRSLALRRSSAFDACVEASSRCDDRASASARQARFHDIVSPIRVDSSHATASAARDLRFEVEALVEVLESFRVFRSSCMTLPQVEVKLGQEALVAQLSGDAHAFDELGHRALLVAERVLDRAEPRLRIGPSL